MKKTLTCISIGLLLLAGCQKEAPAPSPTAAGTPAVSATASSSPTPASSPETKEVSSEFLIVPGQSMGQITRSSTEEQLKSIYGAENVKAESIYVGDGMEWPGLAVFGDDPEKRVEVVFEEGSPGKIVMLKIWGEKSMWQTSEGVSLGTDLVTLEKLNGKPFELMGLEWDFGGGIINWNDGALKGLNLRVGLTENSPELTEEETGKILGDQQVKSDEPAMTKANPRVFQITVNFPPE